MKSLVIAPNKPLLLALVDPEGQFDLDRGIGTYQTTTGATLVLPRPAVVLLNLLEPKPQEEIGIQKHWTGRKADKVTWIIALSPRSEKARAEAGEPDTLMQQLGASIEAVQEQKKPVRVPAPIGRPSQRKPAPDTQPRLFDRGTGTHGPAPQIGPEPLPAILPAVARSRIREEQVPANIAVKEILEFIQADPNMANWSDQARQDLASTIIISSWKAGYIGLWERGNK